LAKVTGKVTGTAVLVPFLVTLAWPTVNWFTGARAFEAPVLALALVKVIGARAVMETCLVVVELTPVWGSAVAADWTGAAVVGKA
jgi:hypothetical protein